MIVVYNRGVSGTNFSVPHTGQGGTTASVALVVVVVVVVVRVPVAVTAGGVPVATGGVVDMTPPLEPVDTASGSGKRGLTEIKTGADGI